MDSPILQTRNLTVHGTPFADLELGAGLTLLTTAREASSSSYSLVLSGRMRPDSGTVLYKGTPAPPKRLFPDIALAGIAEIDSLERLVTVRTVVREQIAWATAWYRPTPRDLDRHEPWRRYASALGLDNLDPARLIGDLDVSTRYRLRVALALVARPEASVLIVDDPDQVRDMNLRAGILERLRELSVSRPVIVVSSNPDLDGLADHACVVTGEVAL